MAPGLLFGVITRHAAIPAARTGMERCLRSFQANEYLYGAIFYKDGFCAPRSSEIQQVLIEFFSFHDSFLKRGHGIYTLSDDKFHGFAHVGQAGKPAPHPYTDPGFCRFFSKQKDIEKQKRSVKSRAGNPFAG
jgi:hypothetical protein